MTPAITKTYPNPYLTEHVCNVCGHKFANRKSAERHAKYAHGRTL
jgi:hypothetical protein